jgi:DNA-binding GntR family transcriptional regulator
MTHSNTTYPQVAYDFVKNQIVNLHYKPGEYVTDTQIAGQLSISRTPVREAFLRLEKEGLLVYEPRRGWKVYTLTLKDIHEIFDIKLAVEGMIAHKAAECQDEELRGELKVILETMETAVEADDAECWLQADIRLHAILYQMAGNERANRIINNLNDQWHRIRIGFVALHGRTRRSTREHRSFIESILAGNGDEAEQKMRAHLSLLREELVRLLVAVVLPFAEDGI